VETAHGIVAGVCGIFQFLRFHNLDRDFALVRKSERFFEMSPRRLGNRQYREHWRPGLDAYPGKKAESTPPE